MPAQQGPFHSTLLTPVCAKHLTLATVMLQDVCDSRWMDCFFFADACKPPIHQGAKLQVLPCAAAFHIFPFWLMRVAGGDFSAGFRLDVCPQKS